ncbi:MAG: hypothetical protein JW943_11525 [Deltaproteobacteria bacterium]|nr:hypothetical protein [Deltaproteobacteria bacterium]
MNQNNKENWERNVGRFILETGAIELNLLQLYWNISLDGSYDVAIKEESLPRKIRRVRKKVNVSDICLDLKKEVLDVLKRCSDLVHIRNLVAHNPLKMDFFLDDAGMPQYEPIIRSLRNGEIHLKEEDLNKAISAAQNIVARMSDIIPDDRLWSWREA